MPAELRIVDRLRKRRDFLAAAKAEKAGVASFLLQGRDRRDDGGPRLGFTVTKKNGNAVVRNRIRRRLREAARQVLPQAGRNGFDYVLVARLHALHAPFPDLVRDMERAVAKLHSADTRSGQTRSPRTRAGRTPPEPTRSKTNSAPADGGRPK